MSPISGFVGKGRADMWRIYNGSNERVVACIGWRNEDPCGSVNPDLPYMTRGWYQIQPGDFANVLAENLAEIGPYLLYYAQTESGSLSWFGSNPIGVSLEAFERCLGTTAAGDVSYNFAAIDVGNTEDFTLNLV